MILETSVLRPVIPNSSKTTSMDASVPDFPEYKRPKEETKLQFHLCSDITIKVREFEAIFGFPSLEKEGSE